MAILSDSAWRKYFATDLNILGQQVMLDGTSYSIVGVMPDRFQFPNPQTELWTPFTMRGAGPGAMTRVGMIGRLKEGISIEAAAAETAAIFRDLRGESKTQPAVSPRARVELLSARDQLVGPVRSALLVSLNRQLRLL